MKRSFVLMSTLLGLSIAANAATVSCVINQATTPIDLTTATTTVSCGGVSASTVAANGFGSFIDSIVLTVKGTFNDSAISPAYVGQVSFSFTEQSSQFVINTITGNAPNGPSGADIGSTGNLFGSINGLTLADITTFNVNVVESVLSGGRLPTDSRVTVTYDYHIFTPGSTVPEPASLALIGLGVAGLAAARLRRKR